ncbi:MAG: glycosyltransferase family 2 protein, partial [Myxococcota bacterium]
LWWSVLRLDTSTPEWPRGAWPSVSVIVPSRNEEAAVREATRTLLAMDYPRLQVVAVDDRSTDRTGAILDELAANDPRLAVVHVDNLPPGWLGKNHANHLGARRADGEWLLFTDGDVHFSPDALRRAMALVERCGVDHLAALPLLVCRGFWARAIQTATFSLLTVRYRMWQLRTPRTRGFAGFGAFNLVRRSAYVTSGGHERLRMEVADDIKLGMVLRRSGFAQALADARGLVRVAWQDGVLSSLRGLMKNAFAGTNWQWRWMAPAVLATVLPVVVPFLGMVMAPEPGMKALGAASLVLSMVIHGWAARRMAGGSGLEGLTYPLVALVLGGLMLAAAASATRRGGITWRGTFYPISQLRTGGADERVWRWDGVTGWRSR